jgi:hypothetical protein
MMAHPEQVEDGLQNANVGLYAGNHELLRRQRDELGLKCGAPTAREGHLGKWPAFQVDPQLGDRLPQARGVLLCRHNRNTEFFCRAAQELRPSNHLNPSVDLGDKAGLDVDQEDCSTFSGAELGFHSEDYGALNPSLN